MPISKTSRVARRQLCESGPPRQRGGLREPREHRRCDRNREHSVGNHIDGVGKGVDRVGTSLPASAATVAVGHHHDRDDLDLLGHNPAEPRTH